MENLNIIEILKLGLPGLVFLLSLLAYQLLNKEQSKDSPKSTILKSIRQFMYVNIFLAALTITAPIVEASFSPMPKLNILKLAAKADGAVMEKGSAAVCISSTYASRYLLVKDTLTGKAIQVFARSVIPCSDGMHISLTLDDAHNLGWTDGKVASTVEVVPAELGQMFVL